MHGWAENIPSCIFAFIILLFLQKELAAIQESFQGEHAVMAIYSSVCLSMYPLLLRINGSHVNFLKSKFKVHVDTEKSTQYKCLGWWILTEWTGLCNDAKSGSEWHRTPRLPSPRPESDPRRRVCPHSWLHSSVLPASELSITGTIKSVLFSDYENNTVI